MKHLFSRIGLVFVLFGGSMHLAAAENTEDAFEPNVHEGNLRVGGTINSSNLKVTTAGFQDGSTSSSANFSLGLQYFILDRFSVGAIVEYSTSTTTDPGGTASTTSTFDLGPMLTYYFWQSNHFAAYASGEGFLNFAGSSNFFSVAVASGIQYFIVPAVAVGPEIRYYHVFHGGNVSSSDQFNFFAGLFVFL